MKKPSEIEAVLERSLRKQVVAPRLDGRFDAAVWSRIEAAAQPLAESRRAAAPKSARWLFMVNAIGAAMTLVLVVYFGVQAFSGVEVSVPSLPAMNVALPTVSATTVTQLESLAPQVITAVALGFALMFTSLGRRLRSELSQFL